ncbi:MAG: hypothetical protein KIH63_000375 [Candidatus Saccharibacteria bacterium]|nr:hypothetical protein [Candidatus Saccharibacteria bacterium]
MRMSEVALDDDHHAYLRGYPYPTRSEMLALRTLGGLTQPGEEVDLDAEFMALMESPAPGFTPLEQAGIVVTTSQGIDRAALEKWQLLQEMNGTYRDLPPEMINLHHQGVHLVIGSAVALASRRSPEVPDDITNANTRLLEELRAQESATFPVLDGFHPDAVVMNAYVLGYDPTAAFQDFTSTPSRLGVFYGEWLESERQRMALGGATDKEWAAMQVALTAGMSTGFEFFQAEYEYRN